MKKQGQQIQLETGMLDQFKTYLYERESSKATIQKYATDICTFYEYLDEKILIDKKTVLEYKEWLQQNYAPASVNSMLVALNQFWEFVGESWLKVKSIKVQKKLFLDKEKEMTKAEYMRLRNTACNQNKKQLSMVIETLAVTGARVSELQFFTVERIQTGRIEVFNKGKRRILLLASGLRKKLLYFAIKSGIKKGCIFVTRTGRPKDRSNLWREMKELAVKSGVDGGKIFPHNLRHLFARTYYQLTKDLAGLADILGHSNMDVTRIYTAETGDVFQRQIERMGLLSKG